MPEAERPETTAENDVAAQPPDARVPRHGGVNETLRECFVEHDDLDAFILISRAAALGTERLWQAVS